MVHEKTRITRNVPFLKFKIYLRKRADATSLYRKANSVHMMEALRMQPTARHRDTTLPTTKGSRRTHTPAQAADVANNSGKPY